MIILPPAKKILVGSKPGGIISLSSPPDKSAQPVLSRPPEFSPLNRTDFVGGLIPSEGPVKILSPDINSAACLAYNVFAADSGAGPKIVSASTTEHPTTSPAKLIVTPRNESFAKRQPLLLDSTGKPITAKS
jgi:hypothetical protein